MPVLVPTSLADAVAAFAVHPGAIPLAGGTDLMVELNEARRRLDDPGAHVLVLNRVPELTSYTVDHAARTVVLGAAVTWATIERGPIAAALPALAQAARTVGSPQIRAAGTVGGNLATCSPAGDGLPVLAALEAVVELASPGGTRALPVAEFMRGVKRTALEPGEIVVSVRVPILDGYQGYSKIGVRNAMVIATASCCVAVHTPSRWVRIALGSVAPTIVRAAQAERFAAEAVDWERGTIGADTARSAGQLAAEATSPITDHRSTADYRRHAVAVMVTRQLQRAFPDA